MRQLREELFALRRDKALAEQKEAEVRMELSAVREQVGLNSWFVHGKWWSGGTVCVCVCVCVCGRGWGGQPSVPGSSPPSELWFICSTSPAFKQIQTQVHH